MSNTFDEQNNPEEYRKRLRQHQLLQRRQRQRLQLIAGICVGFVTLLVLCVVLLRSCDTAPDPTQPPQTAAPTTLPPGTTAPKEGQTVIHLVAGGDINITDSVVAAGKRGAGYNYSPLFMDILPIFSQADAAIVNLEGNLVGAPYGTENASAPMELMTALERAGVDFVQMANSYAIKNGVLGLRTTLERLRQAGLEPLGAFASQEEYQQTQGFTLKDINGVRVAFVSFTKGLNGLTLPGGSEDLVNLLYTDYATGYQKIDEDGIKATLNAIALQQPDITIALLHWGSEHKSIISENQKKIKQLMLENGVDAIIGTHSHYVQTVEYDPDAGTVVAYSLGDLLGDATAADTNYSILLQLQITKDHATGETKVTGCDYTPVYTLTPGRDGENLRLVRLETAMAMYENNHVDRVTAKAYENMKTAKNRIKSKTGL